jgi:hypothetical protein
LVGAPVDSVKKQVKKNSSENGKFGQSNRTWLLSEPFPATDMASEQIPGEATLEPVAGENGWTQPVYFFDDRIDLLSFYGGQEGMISYAFTYFNSPADMDAELWVGSHEAIKVFLNGEVIYNFAGINVYDDDEIYTDKEVISIEEGQNALLVKTLNEYSDYSFALNICEVESNSLYAGNRVEGLTFTTVKDTTGGNEEPVASEIFTSSGFGIQCRPNPASETLLIDFNLTDQALVSVDIYDMHGRLVENITCRNMAAGNHSIVWDIKASERVVKPGNYVCRLTTGSGSVSRMIAVE